MGDSPDSFDTLMNQMSTAAGSAGRRQCWRRRIVRDGPMY